MLSPVVIAVLRLRVLGRLASLFFSTCSSFCIRTEHTLPAQTAQLLPFRAPASQRRVRARGWALTQSLPGAIGDKRLVRLLPVGARARLDGSEGCLSPVRLLTRRDARSVRPTARLRVLRDIGPALGAPPRGCNEAASARDRCQWQFSPRPTL